MVEQRLRRQARSCRQRGRADCLRTMKSSPFCLNASTGGGAPPPRRLFRTASQLFEVMSGFCSEPDSANSFLMIACVSTNQECSWPVDRMRRSVPSVSKPGRTRRLEPLALRVEPHRGRTGQDADAVVRPDRRPVLHAFGVVPHAVGVDDGRAGILRDGDHAAVDMVRHAGDHFLRRGPEPVGRPVAANQIVVAADAAGGDDDRTGMELEIASDAAARLLAALHRRRFQDLAGDAGDGAVGLDQPACPMAEFQCRPARARHARARGARTVRARPDRCPRSDGSAAPNCRGHAPGRRRARPSRRPETSACPCRAAMAASRRRRSRRRLRRPCAARDPRGRSNCAEPIQSCSASSRLSRMRMRRCSGLSTKNRPPSDQKAWPPSEFSPSCSRMITRLPASPSSAAATSPARPPPTMIASACSAMSAPLNRSASNVRCSLRGDQAESDKSDEHR